MDLTKFKHLHELIQYLINHIDYFDGNFVLDEIESGDKVVYDIITYSPYGIQKGSVFIDEDSIYIEIIEGEGTKVEVAKAGYIVNIPYLLFTRDYKDDPYGYFPEVVKGSEEDVRIYNKFFTTQNNGSST